MSGGALAGSEGVTLTPPRMRAFVVAIFIEALGSGMFLPFTVIFFTKAQGESLEMTGRAMTVGALAGVAVGLAAGHLVDRYGAGTVVVASSLLRLISFALYPEIHGEVELTVLVAVTAAGDRMYWTANAPMLSTIFRGRDVDEMRGLTGMVGIIGVGFGAGVGALFARSVLGLHLIAWINSATFGVTGAVLVLALGAHLTRRPAPEEDVASPTRSSSAWRSRPYLQICFAQCLYVLAAYAYVIILPLVILDVMHGPRWLPAASLVAGNVMLVVAQRPVLRIARRTSRLRMLLVAGALYDVSLIALAASGEVHARLVVPFVFGVVIIAAVAEAISTPLMVGAANEAAPYDQKGRYSAVFQTGWGLAEAVAPVIFTSLLVVGNAVLWLGIAGMVALTAPLLVSLQRHFPASVLGTRSEST